MPQTLEVSAGSTISAACEDAIALAGSSKDTVTFDFNGVTVTANPGDTASDLQSKWTADMEAQSKAYRESPEYIAREAERAAEEHRKMTQHLTEPAITEQQLRDAKDPWPYTMDQLKEYVDSVTTRDHDYGTCVYAMSLSAVAAFHYVAHQLGVTGFQASCADLDFLRRTRSMEGPFMLIKAEDALYPQYDLPAKLKEAMKGWKPWLKEQAAEKLKDTSTAAPRVIAHWKKLAAL